MIWIVKWDTASQQEKEKNKKFITFIDGRKSEEFIRTFLYEYYKLTNLTPYEIIENMNKSIIFGYKGYRGHIYIEGNPSLSAYNCDKKKLKFNGDKLISFEFNGKTFLL